MLDARRLRYFVTVAEEGHVTRAAERLGMQQPPLSQQIKLLERELKVQLFRRKPRGVALTEAGQALFAEATDILKRLDRAAQTAQRAARGEIGQIRIGIASTAHFYPLVPRVIRAFRDEHPGIMVSLDEGATSELLNRVRAGATDVAFVRKVFAVEPELAVLHLTDEPMVVALPVTHRLARKSSKPVALRELAGDTFVSYRRPEGPGLTDVVSSACQAGGFVPRFGQEAPRPTSALNFVAAGHGVSIVPQSLERMHLDGVAYRPLERSPRLLAPLNAVSRKRETSEVAKAFLKAVRLAFAEES